MVYSRVLLNILSAFSSKSSFASEQQRGYLFIICHLLRSRLLYLLLNAYQSGSIGQEIIFSVVLFQPQCQAWVGQFPGSQECCILSNPVPSAVGGSRVVLVPDVFLLCPLQGWRTFFLFLFLSYDGSLPMPQGLPDVLFFLLQFQVFHFLGDRRLGRALCFSGCSCFCSPPALYRRESLSRLLLSPSFSYEHLVGVWR